MSCIILLYRPKHYSVMPLKCNTPYPVAVQPYHKVITCYHATLQAVSVKMGNTNFGLSLEVTSVGVGFFLFCFVFF